MNYEKTYISLPPSEQVELSHPDAELRLLEVFYHKIYKVLDNVHVNAFYEENYALRSLNVLKNKFVLSVKRNPPSRISTFSIC